MLFSQYQITNPTTKPGVPKAVPALGVVVGWTWCWQKPMLPRILYPKRVTALPAAVPSRWVTPQLGASTDLRHLHFWNWQKSHMEDYLSIHPSSQATKLLLFSFMVPWVTAWELFSSPLLLAGKFLSFIQPIWRKPAVPHLSETLVHCSPLIWTSQAGSAFTFLKPH